VAACQSNTASASEGHRGPLSPTQLYQVPCPYSLWLRSLSKARGYSGVCRHTGLRQNRSPVRIEDQLEIKLLLLKWGCLGGPPVLKFKARPNFALHHEVLDPLILILDGKLIGAYLICLLLFLAVRIPHHSHRRL